MLKYAEKVLAQKLIKNELKLESRIDSNIVRIFEESEDFLYTRGFVFIQNNFQKTISSRGFDVCIFAGPCGCAQQYIKLSRVNQNCTDAESIKRIFYAWKITPHYKIVLS